MRALHSLVVPAESRDPYAVLYRFWRAGRDISFQQAPVVMGPCFRRDDDGGATFQASPPSLRAQRSNPFFFLRAARWIASRSLSSGAHSRDPLARNDVAMVLDTPSPPRRDAPEALLLSSAQRGRGECRMPAAPGRADLPSANLTPASGRQDHTTSPSAATSFVSSPFDRSRVLKEPALH